MDDRGENHRGDRISEGMEEKQNRSVTAILLNFFVYLHIQSSKSELDKFTTGEKDSKKC